MQLYQKRLNLQLFSSAPNCKYPRFWNVVFEVILESDQFTQMVFKELSLIKNPKPGTVARILISILSEVKLVKFFHNYRFKIEK